MKKIQMLTQDNCPKCVSLKQFLELGLKNKYADHIELVKREENPELFMALVKKHDIMSTPALVAGDNVLYDTSVSKVPSFIEANI